MTKIECPECFGNTTVCGSLGDNNVCQTCRGEGTISDIENAAEQLIAAALSAHTDISHWIAFAERQMRELPGWDYLPCGPTTCGVRESYAVRDRVSEALKNYRTVADALR